MENVLFSELDYSNLESGVGCSFVSSWNKFNNEQLTGEALACRLLKTDSTVIIAGDNPLKKVFGFVCFKPYTSPILSTECVEICALFVDPFMQKKGIGKALLTQAESQVRTRLFVSADQSAVPFYVACGYNLSGSVGMTRYRHMT